MRLGRRRGPTVAIAGAGSAAALHALACAPAGARVTAVASAGGTSARHLAGQLDARRCRPGELPAGAEVLVVATPPRHHVELALQGLAAGAAVLVESPVAATPAAADRVLAAVSAPGAPVLRVAAHLLHAPAWSELTARRASLGPLTHLSVRVARPGPTWGYHAGPPDVGGVLVEEGPQALALVLELAGEPPVGVTARLASGRPDGADDRAELSLRFASGLVAGLELAWRGDGTDAEWALQAAAEDGVLRWELFPDPVLEADGEPVPVPDRHHGLPDPRLGRLGYVDQLADLLATVAGTPGRPGLTAAAALAGLEVVCAGYESAGRGGDEVALPLTGDRDAGPLQRWRG